MTIGITKRAALSGLAAAMAFSVALPLSAIAQEKPRYAMLVRVLGNTAFELARIGAQEAADERGVELIYTGPTENTAEGQVALINSLIAQRVDAIMLSANDATALTPSLKRAKQRGIAVVTWDQDTEIEARSLHIASATNELIALGPAKIALEMADGEGDIGIISGPANSTTQNLWVDEMVRLTKEEDAFKGLNVVEVAYGDERSDKGYNEALGLVNKYENLEVIVAYSSVGIAASSQMVRDQNLIGKVKVTGLGFPTEMVDHVTSGATPAFAIWNMIDVGYTTVQATYALLNSNITGAEGDKITAGRMGDISVGSDGVAVMGELFVYDASNVAEAAEQIKSVSK
ncbi:MAG: rhamnose ABC transporter substrate-binding protein [Stappiaceae bacterium]